MGSVIKNEKTKEKCQIFTPDDIVKDMLDHLGYSDHLYGKTILESSCGNGQFLKEIVIRYIIHYSDNGHGLTDAFKKNPYSIFEYGTTSKFDAEGKAVGTGLGMYIVASSINEYNGRYTITNVENGFGLDITIPLSEEGL